MNLRVIHWRSLITGATGNGEPIEGPIAIRTAEQMNAEYAGILTHWTVPAPPMPVVTLVDGKVTIEGAS